LKAAITKAEPGQDTIYFQGPAIEQEAPGELYTDGVDLWAKCGPGDSREPVITVMLIGED